MERFEVTIRKPSEIPVVIDLLTSYSITSVYLTHKTAEINPILVAAQLLEQIHGLDLITTISTRYYARLEEITQILDTAKANAVQEILLVSGAKKGPIDSVKVFAQAQTANVNLYCVYNPYLPDEQLQNEQQRLVHKLKNPQLRGVFMQIGTDCTRLEKGVQYVRGIRNAAHIGTSLLFPSQEFLEHFKQRPWADVQFETRYLTDLAYARAKTGEIYQLAQKDQLEILIQLFPLNEKNLEEFLIWKSEQNLYNQSRV